MNKYQVMIDQINGIIKCMSTKDKSKLPETLVKFFDEKAIREPSEVIDPMKPLKEQDISDETLIMLTYINGVLKGEKLFN